MEYESEELEDGVTLSIEACNVDQKRQGGRSRHHQLSTVTIKRLPIFHRVDVTDARLSFRRSPPSRRIRAGLICAVVDNMMSNGTGAFS